MTPTWVAIDRKTDRIIGIDTQSEVQEAANLYFRLSSNETKIRKLKVGMILKED